MSAVDEALLNAGCVSEQLKNEQFSQSLEMNDHRVYMAVFCLFVFHWFAHAVLFDGNAWKRT